MFSTPKWRFIILKLIGSSNHRSPTTLLYLFVSFPFHVFFNSGRLENLWIFSGGKLDLLGIKLDFMYSYGNEVHRFFLHTISIFKYSTKSEILFAWHPNNRMNQGNRKLWKSIYKKLKFQLNDVHLSYKVKWRKKASSADRSTISCEF